jgi:histidyl-tRNA synthetase
LQPNRSVGDQHKLADRKGIPVAVILGPSELETGTAAIKSLRGGEQLAVPLDDVAQAVRERLATRIERGDAMAPWDGRSRERGAASTGAR